jgi:hypothetical protein
VTRPALETVARLMSLDVHWTVCPDIVEPRLPVTVAESCPVALVPACSVSVDGETETLATVSGVGVVGVDGLDGESPPPPHATNVKPMSARTIVTLRRVTDG